MEPMITPKKPVCLKSGTECLHAFRNRLQRASCSQELDIDSRIGAAESKLLKDVTHNEIHILRLPLSISPISRIPARTRACAHTHTHYLKTCARVCGCVCERPFVCLYCLGAIHLRRSQKIGFLTHPLSS